MPVTTSSFATTLRKQSGAGMIEVMVSALIMAIGLLGVFGMQIRSLQFSQQAYFYSQATFYAQDMAERIFVNSDAIDSYPIDFGSFRSGNETAAVP